MKGENEDCDLVLPLNTTRRGVKNRDGENNGGGKHSAQWRRTVEISKEQKKKKKKRNKQSN